MLRPTFVIVALVTVLVSCGGRPQAESSSKVATVAGETVTQSDLHAYLQYASRYYAASAGATSGWDCTRSSSTACHQMKQQVLKRLIEQAVVAAYADRHGVRLSQRDEAGITRSLEQLSHTSSTPTSVGQARSLLRQEALVRKVEDAVVGSRVQYGPSVHLVLFRVPIVGTDSRAAALDLATFGTSALPPGTVRRVEWIATFRLSRAERVAALAARPGDFIGPFHRYDHYLVARVLGSGDHPYGRPARAALETRLFRSWLARQVQMEHPVCFGPRGARRACPPGTD